jgi:hypothetical protein
MSKVSSSTALALKYQKAKTYIEMDNNFTLVEVAYKGKRAFGIAKRNCHTDPMVPQRGVDIAYSRALKKLDQQLNPDAYAVKGELIVNTRRR